MSEIQINLKARNLKTNNQASFGGSILKANMEVEAAVDKAHDLDATGMHSVHLHCVLRYVLLGLLDSEQVGDFMQTLHPMEKVCTKSAYQIFADMQTFQKSA